MRTGANDLASPDGQREEIVSSYTVAIDDDVLDAYRVDGWVNNDAISGLIWATFPELAQRQRPEMAASDWSLAEKLRDQQSGPDDDRDSVEIDWSKMEYRAPLAPPNSIAVDGPVYDWLVTQGIDPEQRINEVLREALKNQSQSRSR